VFLVCYNLNRGAPSRANTTATHPPVSKKKKDATEKHALKIPTCDDIAYTRNMGVIQEELTKNKPSYEKMSDAMDQTYLNRRQTVLSSGKSVGALCSEFPLLNTQTYTL